MIICEYSDIRYSEDVFINNLCYAMTLRINKPPIITNFVITLFSNN